MGEAARQTAMNYDWEQISGQWEELIDSYMPQNTSVRRWQKLTTI